MRRIAFLAILALLAGVAACRDGDAAPSAPSAASAAGTPRAAITDAAASGPNALRTAPPHAFEYAVAVQPGKIADFEVPCPVGEAAIAGGHFVSTYDPSGSTRLTFLYSAPLMTSTKFPRAWGYRIRNENTYLLTLNLRVICMP